MYQHHHSIYLIITQNEKKKEVCVLRREENINVFRNNLFSILVDNNHHHQTIKHTESPTQSSTSNLKISHEKAMLVGSASDMNEEEENVVLPLKSSTFVLNALSKKVEEKYDSALLNDAIDTFHMFRCSTKQIFSSLTETIKQIRNVWNARVGFEFRDKDAEKKEEDDDFKLNEDTLSSALDSYLEDSNSVIFENWKKKFAKKNLCNVLFLVRKKRETMRSWMSRLKTLYELVSEKKNLFDIYSKRVTKCVKREDFLDRSK